MTPTAHLLLRIARLLPRGGFRLTRFASRWMPTLRCVPIQVNAIPGIVLHADLAESVWYPLWKYGCYPHQIGEELVLRRLLKPGMIVLDVGANIGYLSAIFAYHCPGGKVFAFEPAFRCLPALREISTYFKEIEVIPCAVTDWDGEVDFLESPQLDRSALTSHVGTRVNCTTLDTFCATNAVRPDLLKVDVEGADASVLRGARTILRDYVQNVMFEALDVDAFSECVDALGRSGRRWRIERIAHNGTTAPVAETCLFDERLTNNYIASRE